MTSARIFMAAALLSIGGTHLSAQWLDYPTAGVPKKPDGSPNLKAPTPRTRDGKPDLSGMWRAERDRACPPDGCPDEPTGKAFFDIGWTLKGGLPYQPWARELVKERMIQNAKDNPRSRCLPSGIVAMHTDPRFRKIVQAAGLTVILNENGAMYRQIFTDGRPLPVDPEPSFNGYSTAKWDGDTLVVQSNGFRDGIWLDVNGDPLTEAARITERFHRVDYGHLEIQITVDDPKAYTAPWTVKLNQFIVLNTDFLDYFCVANEKDVAHMVGK